MKLVQESCLGELAGQYLLRLLAIQLADPSILPSILNNLEEKISPQQLSPSALAYVGDAVYELYVRTRYLLPPKRPQAYHNQVVNQVRAESQAHHLQSLQPHLTEGEREIIRRGRNVASKRPRRVDLEIYQQATGLESLLGYLYLSDPQRLIQLLEQIQFTPAQNSLVQDSVVDEV